MGTGAAGTGTQLWGREEGILPPHLLKHAAHHFHRGIVGRNLHIHLQRLLQDLAHDLRADEGVVLGEVTVQLLHLVLQALDLCLEHLRARERHSNGQ